MIIVFSSRVEQSWQANMVVESLEEETDVNRNYNTDGKYRRPRALATSESGGGSLRDRPQSGKTFRKHSQAGQGSSRIAEGRRFGDAGIQRRQGGILAFAI